LSVSQFGIAGKQKNENCLRHFQMQNWKTLRDCRSYRIYGVRYPEAGKKHTEKGLKIHLESGVEMFLSLSHCQLGWIRLELGDLNHARSLAEDALRLSQKNNEKHVEAWSWLLLGTTMGKIKPLQIGKAGGCILKGIELGKEMGMKVVYSLGHLFLGQLYLSAGEKEKAMDNLKQSEAMFSEMGMDYWLGKSQEALETL
jgi:tetratricopeptide (TPR) repeat protein